MNAPFDLVTIVASVDAVLPLEFIARALVKLAAGAYGRNRLRGANHEASRNSSNAS